MVYSKKENASSSFVSSLVLIGRSGDEDIGELRFSNRAGGRLWFVEWCLSIPFVVESVDWDVLRLEADGLSIGVVERLWLTTLSSISLSEGVRLIIGERPRGGSTGARDNSSRLKCDSIVVGGDWERWFVIAVNDVGFFATVVGPIDTFCCLEFLLVRLWLVNWLFSLEFVVAERSDWLSISSRCSKKIDF